MGAKQAGKAIVVDAANFNPTGSQKDPKSAIEDEIREGFRRASTNSVVTKDKFNESLYIIEKTTSIRLRDTPLAEKMFYFLDTDKNGIIDETEFMQGLTKFITDPETRIQITFKAHDKDNDNIIKINEFTDFFEESWKCAFRCLGDKVAKGANPHNISSTKIEKWAAANVPKLRMEAQTLFQQIDTTRRGGLDYPTFRNWCKTTDVSAIIATFDNETVEIPVNLYKVTTI